MLNEKPPTEVEAQASDSNTEVDVINVLGYKPELRRNRSMFTLLFQSLAIAAIPLGFGGPLISAIYGGGQLPMFLGWIMVLVVDQCVALSLAELASRYPTSAGPYYWSFQLAPRNVRTLLSFITGWTWLIGNWTITLSVNFAFASLVAACISMFQPEFVVTAWQLLLIVYAITLLTFFVVAFGNRLLPLADTFAAGFTLIAIIVTLVCLSVKADAGRNSPADALGHYDTSLSGWGSFSFFIGILPAAYTFSAVGMVSAMAEECDNPTIKLPKAMALCVPVGGIAGLFYIIPICATMPSLETIIAAPVGQALPYIFQIVMGSPAGGLGLTLLVLIITFFCSVSITTIGSRCTWAFARDNAIPGSRLFRRLHGETPVAALALSTIVQMLLGLINLGSSSAFLAFVSVGLMALAISYAIPISISMWHCRREVNRARWTMGPTVGWPVNAITVIWIAFEMVLFSMPTVLPVTEVSMNYAIVVFVGFMVLSGLWYLVYAHKVYKGPPESDGLSVDTHMQVVADGPASRSDG